MTQRNEERKKITIDIFTTILNFQRKIVEEIQYKQEQELQIEQQKEYYYSEGDQIRAICWFFGTLLLALLSHQVFMLILPIFFIFVYIDVRRNLRQKHEKEYKGAANQ